MNSSNVETQESTKVAGSGKKTAVIIGVIALVVIAAVVVFVLLFNIKGPKGKYELDGGEFALEFKNGDFVASNVNGTNLIEFNGTYEYDEETGEITLKWKTDIPDYFEIVFSGAIIYDEDSNTVTVGGDDVYKQ